MSASRRFFFLALCVLLCLSAPVFAGTFYMTGSDGTKLYSVDTSTGASTVIGSFGSTATYGLSFSSSGLLYALTNVFGTARLGSVDLGTGALTTIGSTGINGLIGLQFVGSDLYAIDTATKLYKLDPVTGASTLVGSTGMTQGMDLALSPSGTLYALATPPGSSKVYTIDLATGLATLVQSFSVTNLMGLAFDSSGNLYSTDYIASTNLYQLNLATGAATLVGNTGIMKGHGGDIYAVPEPATCLLAGAGLLAVSLLTRRRRG